MKVTYYGHSCLLVETCGSTLLFDPFISQNPLAGSVDYANLHPDYILLTHGHFDHVADAEAIARLSGATLVGCFEVVQWFASKGIEKTLPMNSGGSLDLPFGRVTLTPAVHSSSMPDGSYGGQAGGFRIETAEGAFYHSGDTALTRDISLIGEAGPLKFAALCIGDSFTMGVKDAVTAAGWLGCIEIIGLHYDTFPPIRIDHDASREAFARAGRNLHLMEIGATLEF